MTTTWLPNAIGLFATTVSALLLFLYLQAAPRFAAELQTPAAKLAFAKHQRSLSIAVGLLAAWLAFQYLSLILP